MEDILLKYAGYFIALITALFAAIQFRSKNKAQQENIQLRHLLDQNASFRQELLEKYQEYLKHLNAFIYEADRNTSGGGLVGTMNELLDEEKHLERDVDIQAGFYKHRDKQYEEWEKTQLDLLEKLEGLKLLANDELAVCLNQFKNAATDFINATLSFAGTDPTYSDQVEYENKTKNLSRLCKELQRIKAKIEKQMRSDILPSI